MIIKDSNTKCNKEDKEFECYTVDCVSYQIGLRCSTTIRLQVPFSYTYLLLPNSTIEEVNYLVIAFFNMTFIKGRRGYMQTISLLPKLLFISTKLSA